MKENIALYGAIREHILHKEDEITNETIYMFVTYFALLAIGFIWGSWLSLISFIDLIVFQSMINSSQWSITKASIYIRIFFETKYDDMHWELLHIDGFYESIYNEINRNIGWYTCKCGASFLALISFLAIFFSALNASNWKLAAISSSTAVQIVLAFILCAITVYVNRLYFRIRDNDGIAVQKLVSAVEAFYGNVTK